MRIKEALGQQYLDPDFFQKQNFYVFCVFLCLMICEPVSQPQTEKLQRQGGQRTCSQTCSRLPTHAWYSLTCDPSTIITLNRNTLFLPLSRYHFGAWVQSSAWHAWIIEHEVLLCFIIWIGKKVLKFFEFYVNKTKRQEIFVEQLTLQRRLWQESSLCQTSTNLCKQVLDRHRSSSHAMHTRLPAAGKTSLVACAVQATWQTKTQICWKLILISSSVYSYCLKKWKHSTISFLLALPLHCASPKPLHAQHFFRNYNCFRGRKTKALEV